MPFDNNTNTLVNDDSKTRIDVEAMARIELSDIDFLLEKIRTEKDARLVRIMYESLVQKASAVYQLAMRACKYLEQPEFLKKMQATYPKTSPSGIGAVGRYREDLFHDGISFIDKLQFYPFGKLTGRGFVGIRVRKGGALRIKGLVDFEATDTEYAITSEGIFEIHDAGEPRERWVLVDRFPSVTAVNYDKIDGILCEAIEDLRGIWNQLSAIRKHGDGTHEYAYLNEGGTWDLFEKNGTQLNSYTADQKCLVVEGDLTVTPPNEMTITGNSVTYR